jgi:hypothetical protein
MLNDTWLAPSGTVTMAGTLIERMLACSETTVPPGPALRFKRTSPLVDAPPMIEVEAKISRLGMTLLGEPIAFGDQVVYFQSKTVLEVFHTLIMQGRPDMWIVGVLVLMFSVVFPILKISAACLCLYNPSLLRENQVARFLVLESSKWSMADVMALAIFMAFVAFNGLIANTMGGLKETGAELAIPTDSSKLLPGYYLFIGFCIASLFLSKKLERGIRTSQGTEPD